ncbi:MATE family efflux transporter [Erythrobacter sp. SCSIO 43205]|uniref:MATE family efflux transporter n=1 Tax=Erythrobacter sp. SCSIO 43205 TaxID=2779361 RepID=UPI001CAA07C9|nr:MATE family efflux transporter [Erythrobacter sp. SCSIO 43205]UAB77963.1 MATE family efflux transporter [Erythrobacter sp. SCSIO 43205]
MNSSNNLSPQNAAAKLTKGSIRGHLVSQTLPAIVGVTAIMSIGLVDAYFIGKLGSQELAAISFIFPVTTALSSLGVGVMVGINSVVARALGEGDEERCARRANFGLVFSVLIGILIGAALYALIEPLFTLMNAPENLRGLILDYMEPFALGFPLVLAIMGFNGVLRGQGEAKKTSYVSLTYAAANWVLDPILITGAFGFEGFGITGAAYASIIGYGIGAVMAFFLLRRTDIPLDPSLIRKGSWTDPAAAILKVAGPASFSNSINPIGLSVLTAIIATQSEAAVAGFGAAGRLQSFATVPLLALSGSIGAIVGQNWGAREYERARRAALYAFGFCLAWGVLLVIVFVPLAGQFARVFTNDPAVTQEFVSYINIASWGYAGFGILIVANGILNAIDKAAYALTQSAVRVFLIMLPFAWLFIGEWGSEAVFSAELAANIVGGMTGAALAYWLLKTRAPDSNGL